MENNEQTTNLGRPRLSEDEPTRKATISMPESYWAFLESMGRNTSAAVRELIERAMAEEYDQHG